MINNKPTASLQVLLSLTVNEKGETICKIGKSFLL